MMLQPSGAAQEARERPLVVVGVTGGGSAEGPAVDRFQADAPQPLGGSGAGVTGPEVQVELTNTRSRRSGVRMTVSSCGPWLTDRPDQAPPRKSATSHPGSKPRPSTEPSASTGGHSRPGAPRAATCVPCQNSDSCSELVFLCSSGRAAADRDPYRRHPLRPALATLHGESARTRRPEPAVHPAVGGRAEPRHAQPVRGGPDAPVLDEFRQAAVHQHGARHRAAVRDTG